MENPVSTANDGRRAPLSPPPSSIVTRLPTKPTSKITWSMRNHLMSLKICTSIRTSAPVFLYGRRAAITVAVRSTSVQPQHTRSSGGKGVVLNRTQKTGNAEVIAAERLVKVSILFQPDRKKRSFPKK
mmetsp:Transcript_17309/g.33753  ORF Transcript_17309/g.33753 Transcript_17309/m.33753 type:complete len:128 (-) Transcript_17309:2064-2447(-)